MKKERLLDSLGKIDEELIAEAAPENKQTKRNRMRMKWLKRSVVAASVILVLVGVIDTLGRLDYTFKASCGAGLGTMVNGIYYYSEPHKGILKYTPEGESELLLHTYWFGEDWAVNEYGIYYRDDMSVYVRDHETGTRTKLYTSDSAENTHMRFQLWDDNNIVVTNYNKRTEFSYEVIVDGVNGGVLETVMEKTSYKDSKLVHYSDMHYMVGEREITLEPVDAERTKFVVMENGENILPDEMYVTAQYRFSSNYENILLLSKYEDENYCTVFAIYSDGNNQMLQLPPYGNYSGNDQFLYYAVPLDNAIGCVNARTGASWYLEIETNGKEYEKAHNVVSDGEYMYTCGPAGGETALWKLVYDETGRPIKMSLIDHDIKSDSR